MATPTLQVSEELVEQLSSEVWSEPVQVRLVDGVAVCRQPENPWLVTVRGYCPVCGGGLTVVDGGVYCRDLDCSDRYAASRMLRGR